MQEALKNPHYKKIWEKVIMNRHPGAKSLEEALQMELEYDECLILSPHHQNNDGTYPYIGYYYTWDYDYDDEDCSIEILGRPIMLECLMLFLKLKFQHDKHWVNEADITYHEGMLGHWCDTNYGNTYFDLCTWQLTKPFHEQTPETWEKISNLI